MCENGQKIVITCAEEKNETIEETAYIMINRKSKQSPGVLNKEGTQARKHNS